MLCDVFVAAAVCVVLDVSVVVVVIVVLITCGVRGVGGGGGGVWYLPFQNSIPIYDYERGVCSLPRR